MNLCNKRLVAEVILEVIMLMAPTYLDTLGAAGEFILKLNEATMEFACNGAKAPQIAQAVDYELPQVL